MDECLASTLDTAVLERLEYLDLLVAKSVEPSRASLAKTEITRLADAWRALLEMHAPNEHGRCSQCSGWLRPRRHPCTVRSAAHQHLIAADGSPAAGAGRHAAAAGWPTVVTLAAS